MSYAIEVRKAPVRIYGIRGEGFAAEVFLHAARPHDPGVETIGDRLNNSEEKFLPCQTETEVCLIRIGAIAYLECIDPGPELTRIDEVGGARVRVQVDLTTGDRLEGHILCELPEGYRLSDFLNTDGNRFVLLSEGQRTLFVNKSAIDRLVE